MAIGAYFAHGNFPPASYEKAIAELEAAGHGTPAGRIQHFALSAEDGNIVVFESWESPAAMDAFGPVLMPVLAGLGVGLLPPTIMPVHNNVEG